MVHCHCIACIFYHSSDGYKNSTTGNKPLNSKLYILIQIFWYLQNSEFYGNESIVYIHKYKFKYVWTCKWDTFSSSKLKLSRWCIERGDDGKMQWWKWKMSVIVIVLVVCFVILLGWLKSTKFFILLRTPNNFLIPFLASFAKSSKTLLNFFLNFVHLETFSLKAQKLCCRVVRFLE